MKKILLSVAILAIAGAVVVGGTTAIFSDTEVSTGNTFTAGAIDLTIDNESYYNGTLNDGTTWTVATDLVEGQHMFFDFGDVKPGDYGEDTISLHVNNNDSYLCADVTMTENADNGSTEPEVNDENDGGNGWTAGRGELADNIHLIWWADDGDNVLEDNETVISEGVIGDLALGQTLTVPLADSQHNIWNQGGAGGPLPGDSIRYIGKAWCFGEIDNDWLTNVSGSRPVQDGHGDQVSPAQGGIYGIPCSGASQDNSTQTDSVKGNVTFRAMQARHNDTFICQPETQPETGALTVDKLIAFSDINTDVQVSDFELRVTGPSNYDQVFTDEISVSGLEPGTYNVTETYRGTTSFNYTASFGLDCDSNGNVVLGAGDNLTCKLINTEN